MGTQYASRISYQRDVYTLIFVVSMIVAWTHAAFPYPPFKRLWILIRRSIASLAPSMWMRGRVSLPLNWKDLMDGSHPKVSQGALLHCVPAESVLYLESSRGASEVQFQWQRPILEDSENQKDSKEVPLLPSLCFFFHIFNGWHRGNHAKDLTGFHARLHENHKPWGRCTEMSSLSSSQSYVISVLDDSERAVESRGFLWTLRERMLFAHGFLCQWNSHSGQ